MKKLPAASLAGTDNTSSSGEVFTLSSDTTGHGEAYDYMLSFAKDRNAFI